MNELQIELTKLIGSKKLSFGCYITLQGGGDTRLDGNHRITGKKIWWNELPYATSVLDLCGQCGEKVENNRNNSAEHIKGIIGHPATITDLHRWIISKFRYGFRQEYDKYSKHIIIRILDNSVVRMDNSHQKAIKYDSSLDLLDQPEETLKEIIDFIKANQ